MHETALLETRLTERETEILELMSQGLSTRIMSSQLYIAESTVKMHIANTMRKLNANNRTHAVALYIRNSI
ncbi:response regulator transcription factor [Nocardia huaxiensis]|uniref:Response regulator transcription factor n=1 Tax=Nocardia huaxiensis TaxID=2755382 RepID=A0A7D6ZPP0_9NOCA|nr:LuxR C-terminal-related transcriptional regulator [Nocardia huaxiensis]QLY32303.1 response regulator transcription factor [Nocardia huaxiensis]UFS93992.1 LuxR C-terminal-related transcriptional regulator [Nocardia huaxiensis]